MHRFTTYAAAVFMTLPLPGAADDITDALNAAIEAYNAGEIGDTLGELAYATQLLNALQADGLTSFLPEPLPGWTQIIGDDTSNALGFLGGGIASEAEYSGPGGFFTITMMADNPMVAQMGAMLNNSALLSTMGTIVRINRENFLNADGDLSGLIGNRILIQGEGDDLDAIIAHLETIDFDELEDFDD